MTTFLLIRHATHGVVGETLTGRAPTVHLSAEGRAQAEALATRLEPLPIRALYSSPLARTRETAEILGERLGTAARFDEALAEVDFGAWVGRSFEELADDPQWQQWNTLRSCTPAPGGEWMLGAQLRIVTTLGAIRAQHPGELVAVVSHGDLIRAALAHFLGVPLDLFLRIEIDCASVSVVTWEPRGPRVLCVNHVGATPVVSRD